MTSTAIPAINANFANDLQSSTRLLIENILPNPLTGSRRSGLNAKASVLKFQPPMSAGEASAAASVAARSGIIPSSASPLDTPRLRSMMSSWTRSSPRTDRLDASISMSERAASAPNSINAPVAASVTAAAPRSTERGT